MSKYDALRAHLRGRSRDVTMSFDEIAAIVPGGLPRSARVHSAWWSNEEDGRHVQARAWRSAGYEVIVDLRAQSALFVRRA